MNYMESATYSDSELYKLCQLYGLNAKIWLRKFAGLLPEVFRRGLHRRRGCASIHEFAKKLAGMNERTVDKILNLYERLKDKPVLLQLFLAGEYGWSKFEVIAFMADKENEEDLADKIRTLPYHALAEFVRNYRREITGAGQAQNNPRIPQGEAELLISILEPPNQKTIFREISDCMSYGKAYPSDISQARVELLAPTAQVSKQPIFSVHLSEKSRAKLDHMKSMMEKRHRKTLTWDEAFKAWPIEPQKTVIQTVCPDCAAKKSKQNKRPIPQAIQKLVFATHGYTCAFPGCNKPYHELHHVYPWAKHKTHDPSQIYPLCKAHHALAHAGLIADMHQPPQNWRITKMPRQSSIDKKVMSHRSGH